MLDPVQGDDKTLYVSPDIVPVYRDILCPLADIITPNQFEAELLTGVKINSLSECLQAIQVLHSNGVSKVVITSMELPEMPNKLILVGSDRQGEAFYIEMKKLNARFTGTGDLLAALILAYDSEHGLRGACELGISVLQDVLQQTIKLSGNPDEISIMDSVNAERRGKVDLETTKRRELKLIQSRDIILASKVRFTAKTLDRSSIN